MNFSYIYNRAKRLLITPSLEWESIRTGISEKTQIISSYLAPLFIAYISIELMYLILGTNSFSFLYCIAKPTSTLFVLLASLLLSYFALSEVIKYFGYSNNQIHVFNLVGYSTTSSIVGLVLSTLFNSIFFSFLGVVYSGYLVFVGLDKLLYMKEEKRAIITVVSIIIFMISYSLFNRLTSLILSSIFQDNMYDI